MSSRGRLVLLRHGETEWSATGRHTGRTDLPLTSAGERDAAALRGPLGTFDVARVVSSPLQRARRTAELAGLRVDRVDPDLHEWDYGGYEGLTTPQVRERRGGDAWTVFEDGVVPGDTPGETVEEVAARASRVLQRVEPDLATGDVVLVGHGHALRVLTATYLRQEPRFGACVVLDAGALCVLGQEHGRPAILAWNARDRPTG
ncbi:histidine phosphatase family protein [Phycicoccus jejuensis]|uniref:histidine phosphatase family protein n=1 Tax=Phycicoccus jejuensis TaxID=367299 RepID=UPI0004C30B5B|nr:histidine phosphatase family protein [Phycicoccus jejuensis]